MFGRLSAALLARAWRSPMVSPGLFICGRIESDFSNSFPISLIRPGFSSRAGGAGDGAGSPCCGVDRSGTAFWAGPWAPSEDGGEDGGAACGHAAPAAIVNSNNAAFAVATCVLDWA